MLTTHLELLYVNPDNPNSKKILESDVLRIVNSLNLLFSEAFRLKDLPEKIEFDYEPTQRLGKRAKPILTDGERTALIRKLVFDLEGYRNEGYTYKNYSQITFIVMTLLKFFQAPRYPFFESLRLNKVKLNEEVRFFRSGMQHKNFPEYSEVMNLLVPVQTVNYKKKAPQKKLWAETGSGNCPSL